MKRLILILLLIPSLAFGTYQEFYCVSGGSNVNGGSSTGTSALYTSTNGNWSTTTHIFIPTDGSTPASTVNVGDYASVYNDGATVAVYIVRVTAVAAGVNGGITTSTTTLAGSAPTTSATGRSIKVGGAWKGPNGASAFPISLITLQGMKDGSGNIPRINFKNNQTYSITTGMTIQLNSTLGVVYEGYATTPGDGGKATIDGGTSAIVLLTGNASQSGLVLIDLIFQNNGTTGSNALVNVATGSNTFIRCVFNNSRGAAVEFNGTSGNNLLYECEAYSNNKAGSISIFNAVANSTFIRLYMHDCTGAGAAGVNIANVLGLTTLIGCVFDTVAFPVASQVASGPGNIFISGCEFYNSSGGGVTVSVASIDGLFIENSNFIKNSTYGVDGNVATFLYGYLYNNGYGTGTQANGTSDTHTMFGVAESGKVSYASNLTPWVDPANGDFKINLATAISTGRGVFTETDLLLSAPNTVGFPDIGAAQSLNGTGINREVSYGAGY